MNEDIEVKLLIDPLQRMVMAGEPERFIHTITGQVLVLEDLDDDTGSPVGEFRAFRVDGDAALAEGEDLHWLLDSEAETAPYMSLYEADAWSKPMRKAAGLDAVGLDLFILDRLLLEPAVRGRGIGLRVLAWLALYESAGAEVVAMRPFPLQCEGHHDPAEAARFRLADLPLDEKRSTAKLRAYYTKLGFKQVAQTDIMIATPATDRDTLLQHLDGV